MESTF